MNDPACSTDACATNMGLIHLHAGDLVGAYRYFEPLAEQGDADAVEHLIDICQRAGDVERASMWRGRRH
jgi:hypothetical protein